MRFLYTNMHLQWFLCLPSGEFWVWHKHDILLIELLFLSMLWEQDVLEAPCHVQGFSWPLVANVNWLGREPKLWNLLYRQQDNFWLILPDTYILLEEKHITSFLLLPSPPQPSNPLRSRRKTFSEIFHSPRIFGIWTWRSLLVLSVEIKQRTAGRL